MRLRGIIKWFDYAKGYGSIIREDAADVFVAISAFQGQGLRTIAAGQAVEFDVVAGPEGLEASNVIVL